MSQAGKLASEGLLFVRYEMICRIVSVRMYTVKFYDVWVMRTLAEDTCAESGTKKQFSTTRSMQLAPLALKQCTSSVESTKTFY